MKKMILLASMIFAIQAQAVNIVVPHVTPHISTSSFTSTNSISKINNTAKTIKPNMVKPNKIIEAQGSKEVVQATNVSVGSLNSSVKSFGCEVPKVEKKVEPPKCDK